MHVIVLLYIYLFNSVGYEAENNQTHESRDLLSYNIDVMK